MAATTRAERFYGDTKTVALEDVPIPDPGPGEVLVKAAFRGICHSDLSLINGTFPPLRPVVTQGHEASGTIAKLGPGVTGWAEGDRVVVAAGRPCRTCPNCLRGDTSGYRRPEIDVRASLCLSDARRPADGRRDEHGFADHRIHRGAGADP
jgi:D-arabinose 1-dehydrogenase-like Zn-dependent alcohol dehydrogenase